MGKHLVFLVLPCLNEERFILTTCQSLGFPIESSRHDNRFLIIVDNGSTDKTIEIAQHIKDNSPPGKIFIIEQRERGYVPARCTGNQKASEIAKQKGIDLNHVLIIQMDADTLYSESYVDKIENALLSANRNTLVEGKSEYPTGFVQAFPNYVNICEQIDNSLVSLFADEDQDVIVDDKMVGYLLSDYYKWGEFKREYIGGEEIYAETTRLFMRAKALDAKRIRVENAIGYHSTRKILEAPLMSLATAGFPRERSWVTRWADNAENHISIHELPGKATSELLVNAVNQRRLHILAIFSILPLHVANTLGKNHSRGKYGDITLDLLPNRTRDELINRPSVFINDAFSLAEKKGTHLLQYVFS